MFEHILGKVFTQHHMLSNSAYTKVDRVLFLFVHLFANSMMVYHHIVLFLLTVALSASFFATSLVVASLVASFGVLCHFGIVAFGSFSAENK